MAYNLNNIYPKPAWSAGSSVADQRLSVDNTVGGVQFSAFNASTDLVVLDVQTADVMVTFDSSAPTTTNGHRLYAGTTYTWSRAAATAAKFIRATATTAAIHASEFQV